MSENRATTRPDRQYIALGNRYEIAYWTMIFGCTRERLLDAVRQVGTSVEAVAQHLGRRGPPL
jgi:hypothetical protein